MKEEELARLKAELEALNMQLHVQWLSQTWCDETASRRTIVQARIAELEK